jgi:tetratricopeptide (TPR) repeat protein
MRVDWTSKDDPPEVKKLLADYENQQEQTKRARIRALAELTGEGGVPALCRLVRYEKSARLSKYAALQLFGRKPLGAAPAAKTAETVRKQLEGCTRTAAKWLLTWLQFADDAQAASAAWAKHIAAEQALLARAAGETTPDLVAGLVRFQIQWLKKHSQTDAAVAAMRQLIELEEGDPETLVELLEWFVQQKAWKAIDELAQRFKPQFDDNPVLLYALAQAQLEQDQKDRAEATAAKALKLNPGTRGEPLMAHLRTALQLRQRGLFGWAEREFRYVMETGAAVPALAFGARFTLAEMLHDQADDQKAADLLEEGLKQAEAKKKLADGDEIGRRTAGEIRSRLWLFRACSHEKQNEPAKRREELLKGMEVERPDIDLLIAVNRLPDLKPDERRRVDDAIRAFTAEFQEDINNQPTNSTGYNQWAWLVGNTSRNAADLDQAIKHSEKSLELYPDNGGYYDTLGHVYFAKGDYENAVRYQTRAAELEPHHAIIARQLKVFQEKLKTQKATPEERR